MPIEDIIKQTTEPATIPSLVRDLSTLGLEPGMTVIVHSSLGALGYVCGGAVAVIVALQRCLGREGTVVMPTHSNDFSDPAEWENPPVPESWWETIRRNMPAFRPDRTPCTYMGAIPECFRAQRGVSRSSHPLYSFAAWGKHAEDIVDGHQLEYGLGDGSPLARVYDLDGWVLLLGVGHENNTSLHLSEYRADFAGKDEVKQGVPMFVDGRRQWVTYPELNWDESDFGQIGEDFARETDYQQHGTVAQAKTLLVPQRPLVDYAVKWIESNRRYGDGSSGTTKR